MKFFSIAFSSRSIVSSALATLVSICAFTAHAQVPRPEHPRPDFLRTNWVSLNGEWQFEIDDKNDGESRGLKSGHDFSSSITVPFCPESKLSGVGHYGIMNYTWYRRAFEVPAAMQGKRILMHFGAVDYVARVWVNGAEAGSHTGGSVPFDFDVTKLLHDGQNEVVVHVYHDVAGGHEPTGKQTHTVSEGCVYTRTTGIWQPVWLEAVGPSYVKYISIVTDPDQSRVTIDADIDGAESGLALKAEAFALDKEVGNASAPAANHTHLEFTLSQKHLWEPGSPFLYNLKLTLSRGDEIVDDVSSYFGLRSVSIDGRSILINGRRIFQRLILDQGFYPDSEWTAPTDAELKADIERSMAAGFNGARLHQKVFEPRYLYWADKLGYLVWGEFPNWGFAYQPQDYAVYTNEWREEVLRDRSHPSIIGWCPFNETPANAGEVQAMVWQQTRELDPTRPVLETSGWSHTIPHPTVRDTHDYNQNPEAFKKHYVDFFSGGAVASAPARYKVSGAGVTDTGLPFMVSEFGGIGWATEGGWGYGDGPKTVEEFYGRYDGLMDALLENQNMFGFCYTQLTDVEQEHNGLYYYDRRPKFDLTRLRDSTARLAAYEKVGPTAPAPSPIADSEWKLLVGAAADGAAAKAYRYTTSQPGANWNAPAMDDHAWSIGNAPFGHALPNVRKEWTTGDIWLRQNFDCDSTSIRSALLVVFFDEDTEVYVNGNLIWKHGGYVSSYQAFDVTDALQQALQKGRNTLAVHTHQTTGGQFIDLALLCRTGEAKPVAVEKP